MEAGGDYQLPYLNAAGRCLRGERNVVCPKCGQGRLRSYFHMMNRDKGTGTLWVWCNLCKTKTHLPRVRFPHGACEPFAHLSLVDFAALELDAKLPWMDRLDQLWEDGKLRG